MNALTFGGHHGLPAHLLLPTQATRTGLDRAAIAAGIADRRARIAAIEDAMEAACETAVRRVIPASDADHPDGRSETAWTVYLCEAVRQSEQWTPELETLRRDAGHLERLLRCVS